MPSEIDYDVDVYLEEDGSPTSMGDEVREGLLDEPKSLPSKYFYDARGSRLFERITKLPEYYLTRAEQSLLERRAHEIARLTRPEELVELGSGSAKKTRLLIDAALACETLRRYRAVEVSQRMAENTAGSLARDYPRLEIHAVIADFETDLTEIPDGGRRLVAFLGSTLGNFPEPEAVELLRKFSALLGHGGHLLLGADLVKDRDVLEAAYNDTEGLTAEFNRNILHVINNLLDGDFDNTAFDHVASYNEQQERIETFLRSTREQSVRLNMIDLEVSFAEGELLSTEVSCKYTRESMERMLHAAGHELEHWLPDATGSYALSISRPI